MDTAHSHQIVAAYNKITANKKVFIYPDFGHEIFPDSRDMVMQWLLEE